VSVASDGGAPLRGVVVRGARWAAGAYYANMGVRLGVSIALARLLGPAEFGLMALAMVVVGLVALVQDSGISAALVQHRGALEQAAATAVTTTAVAGALLGGLVWLLAPAAAALLGEPALTDVVRALAVVCAVRGLGQAPRALLQRALRFRALAAVELSSTAVYGAVGFALAWRGAGVWSLVGAQIASEIALSAVAWTLSPRIALRDVDLGVARELVRFGRHVVAANLLSAVQTQLPALVVGKVLGTAPLGLYTVSHRWASLPVQGVTHVAGRVAYPALSRLRAEPERFADAYLAVLRTVVMVALPLAVGLALVAEPLVQVLYDARWLPLATPLRILAFYGLAHAVAATTGEVYKAAGVPRWVALYGLVYLGLLIAGLWALGTGLGLAGVALATVLAPAAVAVLSLRTVGRLLALPPRRLVAAFTVPLAATTAMAASVAAADTLLAEAAALARLAALVALGAAVYATAVRLAAPALAGELLALAGLGARGATQPTAFAPAARRHRGLAMAALAIAALAVALTGVEAGMRLRARGHTAEALGPWAVRRPWHELRALAPDGSPEPIPNARARWRLQPWNAPVDYRLDAAGLRVAAGAPGGDAAAYAHTSAASGETAAPCRVLVAGDANVFGYGVPAEAALPARLQAALAADGVDARIDNAGVCGSNVRHQRRRLESLLPHRRPDVVLLVVSPWSLRLDAPPDAAADSSRLGWLWRVTARAHQLVARWSAVGDRIARLGFHRAHALTGWPPRSTVAWELEPLAEPPARFAARWLGVGAEFDLLVDAAEAGGATPLVAFVPLDVQVNRARNRLYRDERLPYPAYGFVERDYTRAVRDAETVLTLAAHREVAALDLTPVLRQPVGEVFLADDYHLGPGGYRRLAAALVPFVTRACAAAASEPPSTPSIPFDQAGLHRVGAPSSLRGD